MTIKIGLIGVQGAGKTTTFYGLAHKLKAQGKIVNLVMETAREAIARGFLSDGSNPMQEASQLWMIGRQFQKEIEAEKTSPDFVITDRTIYDPLAYSALFLSGRQIDALSSIIFAYAKLRPYDLLLYFPPLDKPPEVDGVRNASLEFQKQVQEAMERVIIPLDLPLVRLLSKTKSARLENALEAVEAIEAIQTRRAVSIGI